MESTGTVGIGIFKLSNWTEIGSHNCKRNSGSLDSLWDAEYGINGTAQRQVWKKMWCQHFWMTNLSLICILPLYINKS